MDLAFTYISLFKDVILDFLNILNVFIIFDLLNKM